jgi:hypothetical protein
MVDIDPILLSDLAGLIIESARQCHGVVVISLPDLRIGDRKITPKPFYPARPGSNRAPAKSGGAGFETQRAPTNIGHNQAQQFAPL